MTGTVVEVRCWNCNRKLSDVSEGAQGFALMVCKRCGRRNLVDLAEARAGR